VQYIIILVLSNLASIGATPVPSSSLVLIVMIADSVNVPITGMYALIIAIDWFLDRFRTVLNVSGDLFAAKVLQTITKIEDDDAPIVDGEAENRRGDAAV
jgi:Na+/H+-dicarboxylate symporter